MVSESRIFLSMLVALCLTELATAGEVTLQIADPAGETVPCRVHLRDAEGEVVLPDGYPAWRDHFVCDGTAKLTLAPGTYAFEIERGPEYRPVVGDLIAYEQDQTVEVRLTRITDLRAEGWFSGDLHIHRPPEDVPLLMRAEDLDVGPVITWWNNRNPWQDHSVPDPLRWQLDSHRLTDVMAGEDEREGGALLFFGLSRPLPIAGATREYPCPVAFIDLAHQQNSDVWIDIEKPFWWDVPLWVAHGRVDSIGIANNHMCRSQMYESEAWGRPRDERELPPPLGNGFWTQEIYYHLLNCGIRLPPSAGSASGVLPNPVGYNRVYVHLDENLTWDRWWEGLRAGRSFVTNGPLLLCTANGQDPGHIFASDNDPVGIDVTFDVVSNDTVQRIEVLQDGKVVWSGNGRAGECSLTFERSGWFLVRAVTDNPRTFRFASTAPFYVEIGDTPRRISRESVEFFRAWVAERIERVPLKLNDAEQLAEVLQYHESAQAYWDARLAESNAD